MSIFNNYKFGYDETNPWSSTMDISGSKLIALTFGYGSVTSVSCNSVGLTKAYYDNTTVSGWEFAVWFLDSPTTGSGVTIGAVFTGTLLIGLWDMNGLAAGNSINDLIGWQDSSVTTIGGAINTENGGASFSLVFQHVGSSGVFSSIGDQTENEEGSFGSIGYCISTDASDDHEWEITVTETLSFFCVSFTKGSINNSGLFFGTGF